MSGSVKLNLPAGGSKTISAPDSASDETITLPAGTKTLLATDGDGSSLTGVGGGAWTYISSATASTSSTLSFTSLSTAKVYVVVLAEVQGSAPNSTLWMRTSTDGGSSYDSGATDYGYHVMKMNTWSSAYSGDFSNSGAAQMVVGVEVGSDSGEHRSGFIYIFNPSDTTQYTSIKTDLTGTQDNGYSAMSIGVGCRNAITDVDAIQFLMNTGTIKTGTFHLFSID